MVPDARAPIRRLRGWLPGALALAFLTTPLGGAPAAPPRVFLLDPDSLQAARAAIARHDPTIMPAWTALRAEADKALTVTRFSVVDKAIAPPSGDKHDYMSQAPYFWPNPATPNGLPYINRDGERNPEINKITDHLAVDGVVSNTPTLALAFYFTGDERYAAKAAGLLRAFFLDPDTRMNPNLEYGQFVPGVNTGRGIGLIETRGLTRVVDAIGLLASSQAWRAEDDKGVREWFTTFLTWMQESKNGEAEAAAKNNHGTFYDLQVTSYALFVDRAPLARQILEQSKQKRIAVQVEPDGRMPLELARTNAWSYSNMNLDGLTELATLGDRAGVDLWHFTTPDGRSIRAAIVYLAPFAFGDSKWTAKQINGFTASTLFPVLHRAARQYDDADFRKIAARVPAPVDTDRSRLVAFPH